MSRFRIGLMLVCIALATVVSARDITDSAGRTVAVPDNPRHVLSLCTSATDTMLRLGEGSRLAGIDEYSRVVPGATNIAVLGKGSAISREQVLARGIDLAFVWWFQDDAAKLLSECGVSVVRVRCGRAGEVPATIRLVGQCIAQTNAANQLAAGVAAQLEALRQTPPTNAPRVFMELYSPFKTSGRDSYLNDLIELAGGRNVAADASGSILFSSEQLLAADPQRIVLIAGSGTPEQFARRGGLESLSAVKSRRVHVIDRYCLVAGAGLPEGVAALRRILGGTDAVGDVVRSHPDPVAQGRARHSVRAVGNNPNAPVGKRGAQRTAAPYLDVHGAGEHCSSNECFPSSANSNLQSNPPKP